MGRDNPTTETFRFVIKLLQDSGLNVFNELRESLSVVQRLHNPLVGENTRSARKGSPDERKKVNAMPVISKFYGIVIRMLFIQPFTAHFHAIYQDSELVVAISPVRVIQGDAPGRVHKMVLEWAAQHQKELLEAWNRLARAQSPAAIEPLV